MNRTIEDTEAVQARARSLAQDQNNRNWRRTDQAFAALLLLQWLGGIVLAVTVSPYTWFGTEARVHLHVWAAIVLGGVIVALPIVLAWKQAGRNVTRHAIAAGQMLMGALLIHLTGGRIETHFHVFGSLAFLAFYRDWRVLATATVIVVADHLARGIWWPQSVYGALTPDFGRTLEHAGWVIFEDVFLFISIQRTQGDDRRSALRQARLEALNSEFEERVVARTAELKTSEERVQIQAAALQAAANGVVITDRQGIIEWVNPALERLTGYAAHELIGQNPRQLKSGEHPPEFYAELWRTVAAGKVWSGELVNRRKNGELYGEEMTITPVRDATGEVTRFVAIKQDVTERRAAAQLLRESEERFRELVESTSDLVHSVSDQGNFLYANPAWLRTMGFTVAELPALKLFDRIAPEEREHCGELFRRVLAGESLTDIATVFVAKDGRRIYVEGNAHGQKLPDGSSLTRTVFRDCTARHEADMALRASWREINELKSALNEHAIVAFTDARGRITQVNDKFCALSKYSREELVGQDHRLLNSAYHPKTFFRDLWATIRGGKCWHGAIRNRAKDGTEYWVDTTIVPFLDDHGAPRQYIAIRSDITDLKRIEDELIAARDEALSSARMKSEFLANMSHEIRTPMNGVIGMLNLLADTPLGAEQRDFADTARHSAESLLTVLNDILDFSKIEAGKLTFEETDFDLRELVESTLELLAGPAQQKGLELVGSLNAGTPTTLRGDPTRLRQVLLNLVGNAIKFTDRGEVVVGVHAEPDAAGALRMHFSVRDTGIGIAPEVQAKLFQAFTQADGSTTRKYGGTGLGLAISRRLVELMHGQIAVSSEPGRGSTFSFSALLQPGKPAGAPPRRANLTGHRVLVVDDNATNRAVLHHQLIAWGMRDASASNGAEALQALRAAAAAGAPFPIALLDLQMPGMDGVELARAIKAEPALAGTRLVVLTSLGAKIDVATRTSAGIDECLFKPVRQARLFDCLTRSMAEAPATALAASPPAALAPTAATERTLRILLAEDNAVNQKVALGMLRKLGCNADVVGNGREALERQERTPYDVILMDCQMPEMEGYEASHRIRDHEAAQNGGSAHPAYIIALTANALEGDREKCLAAGMDDFLTKPINVATLGAALTRASAVGHGLQTRGEEPTGQSASSQ